MKFFVRPEHKCSVCGSVPTTKHIRPHHYCQKCWDENMKRVRPAVMNQINQAKKEGKTIDLKELKEISHQITKDLV